MRKLYSCLSILLALLLSGVAFEGRGQLFTEPFNYTAHASDGLMKQSSLTWTNFNSGDSILVESGNLSYSGFTSSTGNRITYGGAGIDVYRSFTSQTTGTVYCSFLLKVPSIGSLNTTGGYTLGFSDNTTTNFAATVWLRLSGTNNFNIGINPRTTAANTSWLSNTLDTGTTYLIVIANKIISGTSNDSVKIWINPTLGGSEPISNASAINGGTDLTSFQRLFLRQDSPTATPGVLVIDEIRVGTSWSSVTPAGAPSITGTATATAFTTTYGTASSAQSFSISGSSLTAAIVATAPTGFELSRDGGTTYKDSVWFDQSSGTASGTLRIRLKATASVSGSYNSQNITLTSAGASTVNITTASTGNSVTAKALTITGLNAQDKNFDGTTTANVTGTPAYSGLVNGESFSVTTSGTISWVFASSGVGNNIALIQTNNYTAPSTNYTITQPSLTANITATTAGAPNINSVTPTLSGTLSIDFNGPSFTGGVSITNYKYSIDGGNSYTVRNPAATTSPLVISGLTNGVTYDIRIKAINSVGDGTQSNLVSGTPAAPSTPTLTGTATASAFTTTYGTASSAQTFSISGASLIADITATAPTGFEVSSDGSSYGSTATFTNSGGTASGTLYIRLAATATVSGSYNSLNIELSSASAASVNITTAATGNTVSAKGLTITGLTGDNKVYDATTTATASGTPAYSGLVNGETFSVTGTPSYSFASKTVGNGKAITVTGFTAPSSNYSVTQPTGLTANITTATLTITNPSTTNRVYNGLTSVTVSGTLSGVLLSDVVTLSTTGTIASANVGTGISVTFSVSGADAANYSLTQPGTTVDITTKGLTITGLTGANKVYDGLTTASATGTASYSGLVNGENFSVTGTPSYSFVDASIGNAKTITVTGFTAPSANYSVTQPSLTANITTKGLTITGLTGDNKVYDATTSATASGTPVYSGLVNGETFSVTGTPSYSFASKTVGNGKAITVSGFTAPSSNYSITQPTGLTANITQATLTITNPTATNRAYDATTNVTVGGTLSGVLASDVVTLSTTGTVATAGAGTGKVVTFSISGADAANYSLTQPGTTVDISKANQTITFAPLTTQSYSGSSFSLSYTAATTTASGLTISYSSDNTSVATVSGSTITVAGIGTANITASQAGDANYNAATSVIRLLTVNQASVNLGTYTFTGTACSAAALVASSVVSNITLSSASVSGVSCNTNASGVYSVGGSNWGTTFSSSRYIQFTITPSAGYTLSITSLTFDHLRTSAGANTLNLRSSVDNYASDLTSNITVGTSSNTANITLGGANFTDLSSAVTFRIYGWGGNSTGDLRLDNITPKGYVQVCGGTTPTINTQPTAQSICAGTTLNLSVAATNAVSYQWRLDGTNISGATNSTYTANNVTSANAGNYDVLVNGNAACAFVNSSTVAVTVKSLPIITLLPSSTTICNGSTASLFASGSAVMASAGTESANTGTQAYPSPFTVYFGASKQQFIILASELTSAGYTNGSILDSMAFNVQAIGSSPLSQQNFKVKIGHTASNTMTTTFLTGASTVFGPTTYPSSGTVTTGWNVIKFSTGFTWNGSSNIYVETSFSNNIQGVANNGVSSFVHSPGATLSANYRADNITASAAENATTATATTANRPDFRLYSTTTANYSWSPSTGLNQTTGSSVSASPSTTTIYSVTSTVNGCSTTANDTVIVNTNTWTGAVNNSWNNAGNWSCGIIPNGNGDINIATGSPILDIDLNLMSSKTLTLGGSGTLIIAPTKVLTIAGTAALNGRSVVFKSDATGTGVLGQVTGSVSGATNVTVERYLSNAQATGIYTGGAWRFVSSGVNSTGSIYNNWQEGGLTQSNAPSGYGTYITSNASGNGFDYISGGTTNSMFTYTSGAGPWNSVTNTNVNTLKAGTGYRLWVRCDRTYNLASLGTSSSATKLRATGAPVTGTITMVNTGLTPASNEIANLSPTANAYSLIGNPYWSPVDWQALTKNNVIDYFWAWDPSVSVQGHRAGKYVLVRGANGTTNVPTSNVSKFIQPGQAIFVKNATSGTPSIQWTESAKASTQSAIFKTTTVEGVAQISLMEDTSFIDAAMAFYANGYNNSIDAQDGAKLSNPNENISILRNTTQLTMEERDGNILTTDTIPLRISSLNNAYSYNLSTEINNMPSTVQGFLLNTDNGATTPLNMNGTTVTPITFTGNLMTNYKIVFTNTGSPLSVKDIKLTASKQNNAIVTKWTATEEQAVQSYTVEKSVNGKDYTEMTVVTSKGNGTNDYTWNDQQPVDGNNLYRIKAINRDGKVSYSSIALVNWNAGNSRSMTIYPNPITDGVINLSLNNLEIGEYQATLYNANGQIVYAQSVNHSATNSTITLQMNQKLNNGVYFMVLSNGVESFKQNITIQNK